MNGLRFARHVRQEAQALWTQAEAPRIVARGRLERLPAPVSRYLTRALGGRERTVQTARLRHGGELRTSLDGAWLPIRGEQYFRADEPGFVWWGRVRLGPGLWVDARDRSLAGAGSMRVAFASTFTLADRHGPDLDQGALLRLLGELTFVPTALLDERYVSWTEMDETHARATLRVAGREVAAGFEFGPDGLPLGISAKRFRDVGKSSVLTPWSGELGDFRPVGGLLVPHELRSCWHVDGRRIPVLRFLVERIEYDTAGPY